MTTESKSTALAMVPRTFDEAKMMAGTYAESSLLSIALRNRPADVFVTIMAGQELGLPPMASLRGIHVVEGKPVLAADTMVAVVLADGTAEYFQRIPELDTADSVTFETKRRGAPGPIRCTWTMAMAQQARLTGKDNWQKYPRSMLKARCKAELAREVYPDKLAGVYDPDEADDFRRSGPRAPEPSSGGGWGEAAIDGEIVDAPPPAAKTAAPAPPPPAGPPLLARVLAAETLDQLRALSPEATAMKRGTRERAEVSAAMKTRKAELEAEAKLAAEADAYDAGGRHDDDGDQAGAAA
jgi:hypothetical protein